MTQRQPFVELLRSPTTLQSLVHCLTSLCVCSYDDARPLLVDAERRATTIGAADADVYSLQHLPEETIILAHDSQYVKDTCECRPGAPPAATNTTLVSLCRRLLREARDCGLRVVWVKVRGHSKAAPNGAGAIPDASFATIQGNDMADKAADRGALGEERAAMDIQGYIYHHLHAHVDLEVWQARHAESTRL